MRDVVIPSALQDAMSREAQAAREKAARIILGEAEMEIAHSFEEAAKSYQHNPVALHLRAMNMLYEGLKEKGALMLIPSSAVESMGMGGLMGAAALQQQRLTGGEDPTQTKARRLAHEDRDIRSSGAACLDNAGHRGRDPLHRRLVSLGGLTHVDGSAGSRLRAQGSRLRLRCVPPKNENPRAQRAPAGFAGLKVS